MTEQIFYVNSCAITQINRYQNSKKIILFSFSTFKSKFINIRNWILIFHFSVVQESTY